MLNPKKASYFYAFLIYFNAGCAQMFPAYAKEVSEGIFKVTATGNTFASLTSLQKKVGRKAEKLCAGKVVEYLDAGSLASGESTTYSQNTIQTSNYFTYSRTIKCK